jgi:O-antigen/teichoic acid export membrane protein
MSTGGEEPLPVTAPAAPPESQQAPDDRLESDSITRNAVFATLTTASTALFAAILTLYLVRALSPTGYGNYTLALAVGALFALPMDLGINSSMARFVAERRGDRKAIAGIIADALSLKLAVAGAVGLVTFVAAGKIAELYGHPGLVWPLRGVAIALTAYSLTQLFAAARVAQGRIASGFLIPFTQSVGVTLATVVLVVLGAGATGAAFGRAIGYLLALAVGAYLTVQLFGRASVAIGFRGGGNLPMIARYAGVLALVEGAYNFFDQLDALLIGAFLSASAVGLFQAAGALTVFMDYPGGIVATSVAPRIARSSEGGEPNVDALRSASRFLTIGYGALLAPIVVWANPIVHLLLGSDYDGSVNVLRAFAPFVFLGGVGQLFSFTANYLGQARRRLPIAIAAVLINVFIDILLIPRIGIVAGAIGSDIAIAVYVPAHVLICASVVDLPLRAMTVTLVRTLAAATVMGAVLYSVGTSELSALEWVGGAVGATLAYLAMVLVARELSVTELRAGVAWAGRRLRGAR